MESEILRRRQEVYRLMLGDDKSLVADAMLNLRAAEVSLEAVRKYPPLCIG